MQKINAVIVDDEMSARDVLENLLLRFCPEINVIAKCENVVKAVEVIREQKPQLVFLDVEMPNYSGFEIMQFFTEVDFEIIFVTAYDNYAIKAFEVSAMDYLLKPIGIDRLKTAVAKATKHFEKSEQTQRLELLKNTLQSKQISNISLFDKGQQHIVEIQAIIAIEASESYCIVHTTQKNYFVSKNLLSFEMLLETIPEFIRVHKSWIINKNHLVLYSKTNFSIQLTNNVLAKLSKYKKAEFEIQIRK